MSQHQHLEEHEGKGWTLVRSVSTASTAFRGADGYVLLGQREMEGHCGLEVNDGFALFVSYHIVSHRIASHRIAS